jgi:hypothetical protein
MRHCRSVLIANQQAEHNFLSALMGSSAVPVIVTLGIHAFKQAEVAVISLLQVAVTTTISQSLMAAMGSAVSSATYRLLLAACITLQEQTVRGIAGIRQGPSTQV